MHTYPIIVGVDGSSSAVQATRWAAAEALRRTQPIRLVHTFQLPVGYAPGIVTPAAIRDGMRKQGWDWLREAEQAVAEIAPGLEPELVIHQGPAVPYLIEASRDATMVVLGSRGLGGFTGLLIGSTAVALAGHAHCPVIVARGPEATEGDLVVGVDGTPAGDAVIALAFEEASLRDRGVVAVHSGTDQALEAALAGWPEKYPDVPVHREVVRDHPATALLRHAATAALVVVGTRGQGGFRGLVLGSTSQHLLHHAPCPVAVVPTDQEPASSRAV